MFEDVLAPVCEEKHAFSIESRRNHGDCLQVAQGLEVDRDEHALALQLEEWLAQADERAAQGIAHDILTGIFDRHAET